MAPRSSKPTPEEKRIAALRAAQEEAEDKAEKARSEFNRAVRDYLLGPDGSPTRLSRVLGVSRGRIYQYRDHANAEERETTRTG